MSGGSGATFHCVEESADCLLLTVDTKLYSEEALFRTCYVFTDRCYLLLKPDGDNRVVVEFRKRRQSADLHVLIGEFANELIDQRVRADLSRDTRAIRELIVAQAFAEADLHGSS
jgi:His-Xaa-Ser system protein HxsD